MGWKKASEDERREQIRRGAIRVAARDGVDRLTIRAVAAEAGLSHGLVHFHFGTKEAVIDDVLESTLTWLVDVAAESDPQSSIWQVAESELDGLDTDRVRVLLDFLVRSARQPEVLDRIRHAIMRYESTLRGRLHSGTDLLASTDVPAERVLTNLILGGALRRLVDRAPLSADARPARHEP